MNAHGDVSFMSSRNLSRTAALAALLIAAAPARAQVVINEIVKDIRTFDAGTGAAENREFIELYNAGAQAVNIGGWTMNYWDMSLVTPDYLTLVDTIPADTMLGPGEYYVIGSSNLPETDLPVGAEALFPDLNTVFELRDGPREGSGVIKDAVALDIQRGAEYAALAPEHAAFVGQGWWGQEISYDAVAPNRVVSIGRYLDGRNSNNNGRDFGVLPVTPGASNNRPQIASYAVPNADPLAVGTTINTDYASFVLPRAIDPTVVSALNPNAIPASPQGGKALIAYDETGGGNAIYSENYVNKFELSAFIDPRPLGFANATVAANRIQSEATIYGIGTTDTLFTTPDATGLLGTTFSSNGSKGLGWYIQRIERFGDADFDDDSDVDGNDFLNWQRNVGLTGTATNATGDADANTNTNAADLNYWKVQQGAPGTGEHATTKTFLMLVDMGDGGDSWPADQEWNVIKAFDLTGSAAAWHTLGIDYDPATGAVVAKYDGQTFNFNSATGLVGNFYVGYREGLPSVGGGTARPPTYDLVATAAAGAVPEPASWLVAAAALAVLGARGKRGRSSQKA
jgi:hypothetical protein